MAVTLFRALCVIRAGLVYILLEELKTELPCCLKVSNEAKIANDLNAKCGFEYDSSVSSLEVMFSTASTALEEKGDGNNLICESLLRECTGISISISL